MSAAARVAAAEPDASDPMAAFPPDERIAAALDRVVQLFGATQVLSPTADAALDAREDWSASLMLVRKVAAKVREAQQDTEGAVQVAQRQVREAGVARRAAEERAQQAEAALKSAVARAEQAEEQARAAAERVERAEAQAAEARVWLQRMHDCLLTELGALTSP